MGELFYLDFKSDGWGKVQIDEPVGFSNTSFELKQKDKGYARDVSFGGGETPFEFWSYRNHYLEKILYYNHKFGFESKVNLIIQIKDIDNIVGELDFATATTDDLEYFKCKVIQQGDFQIIKRRNETKVDVMSDKNIDGKSITPLSPQNMLLLNKPTYQVSRWEQIGDYNEQIESGFYQSTFGHINPCINIVKSEIRDTLTGYKTTDFGYPEELRGSDYCMITASDRLTNVNISFSNLSLYFNTYVSGFGANGYAELSLELRHGAIFETSNKVVLLSTSKFEDESFGFSGDINHKIDLLNRGDSIWIYFRLKIRQSGTGPNPKFGIRLNIKNMKTNITAISYSYNSITPTFRLIDVMRQVVKSISGLDIIAPRFDYGGEFYDNRLFNGNFLRNITKNGFKISLKDIEDSLPELNCDYEIAHDGRIFFGTEKDFYTNIECGFFDNTQFSQMNKMPNPRFMVNEFWFMYKRFQSLKENEEVNSADVIHGESKLTLFNKRVENKKEVSVEWCRDAFLIEENRRKSLDISESTASQNDDDIFAIDSVNTLNDVSFEEVTELQHTYISNTQLSLRTKGEVNFVVMGITVGSIFIIKAPDNNAREYTVYEVTNTELKLNKNSGSDISNNSDGVRSTLYSYTLDKDFIPFTNYTNQNIYAFNLQAFDSFSNLRYSIGQNTWNYWKEYLSTCNIYWKDKKAQNTWYKNNPECSITYKGKTIVEGDEFDTSEINPILSPFLFNDIIFCNVEFEEFIELQKKIRSDRGFIRCIDKNERVIKVYPIDMKWDVLDKKLTIKGEEKYESTFMTIDTSSNFTLINNETRLMFLKWEIVDDKLSLYDMNRQRLYNNLYWNNVSVNGALPVSIAQLEGWLKLIP